MKTNIFITVLLAAFLHVACSDWLDVRPQTEKTKDFLFETQKGFRDALVGAYIRLKGGNIYGDALTWGNIEFMAQHWDLPTQSASSARANLKRYEYTNAYVADWMDAIYRDLYSVIADVNSILERVDAKKDLFDPGYFELIKGEALGLRALCHFDVLRLFGPIPSVEIEDKPILPYVKTVTNEVHPHVTYQQFSRLVLDDLDEAERLLENIDPVRVYSIAALNSKEENGGFITRENDFLAYRQVRLNYHAVLALKARACLWMQDKTGAARYARMVIDARDSEGNPTFRLGTQADMTAADYTVSAEHVFALSVHDLTTTANGQFGQGGSLMKQDFDYYLGNLWPAAERATDIRFALWIPRELDNSYKLNRKFIQKPANPILQVPLLRLSEMYLILAECAADLDAAAAAYDTFCKAKGIPFTRFNDEADRASKITREYNREFYAEGQGFFAYKRLNVASILWAAYPITGSPAVYVVPVPRREIEYHDK
jgi:hypothetical protein